MGAGLSIPAGETGDGFATGRYVCGYEETTVSTVSTAQTEGIVAFEGDRSQNVIVLDR